jgi:hypothetical protein
MIVFLQPSSHPIKRLLESGNAEPVVAGEACIVVCCWTLDSGLSILFQSQLEARPLPVTVAPQAFGYGGEAVDMG